MTAFEGCAMLRPARLSLPLRVVSRCSGSGSGPRHPVIPDPVFGRMGFEASCAGGHSSRDAFVLNAFGFADTTIVRRAVKHVDSSTARNIVAYIRSLGPSQHDENVRLFQPKCTPVTGDVEVAHLLYGRD